MKIADLHIYFKSSFACTCCKYRLPKANITPLGISLAPLAQISIYFNIPSSTVAATTVPRSSAEPPPFRHAFSVPPFPLSGKYTPTKIFSKSGEGRGKIALRPHLSTFTFKLSTFFAFLVVCYLSLERGEWCSLTQLVTATDWRVLKRT